MVKFAHMEKANFSSCQKYEYGDFVVGTTKHIFIRRSKITFFY